LKIEIVRKLLFERNYNSLIKKIKKFKPLIRTYACKAY